MLCPPALELTQVWTFQILDAFNLKDMKHASIGYIVQIYVLLD